MCFKATGLIKCLDFWKSITDDEFVLSLIRGDEPLSYLAPVHQSHFPSNIVSSSESHIMELEIQSLLDTGVIEKCTPSTDQFVSNIFLAPKADGSMKKILKLKQFNKSTLYEHFKMEGLYSGLELVYRDCYFASVDLRKAYYSVLMAQNSQISVLNGKADCISIGFCRKACVLDLRFLLGYLVLACKLGKRGFITCSILMIACCNRLLCLIIMLMLRLQ